MEIYLKGYFLGNLGDDLFLRVLTERYPRHDFTVVVDARYAHMYCNTPNIRVVKFSKIERGINKLIDKLGSRRNLYDLIEEKADATVVIGGSLFQEYNGETKEIREVSKLLAGSNPFYVLGANFGPYVTWNYVENAKRCFAKANDVCFRDKKSTGLFSDQLPVRYAPDILFGMEHAAEQTIPDGERKNCVISVIDFSTRKALQPYAKSYIQFVTRAIDYYTRKDYQVTLVSFCKAEGDENAIRDILYHCSQSLKDKLKVLKYDGTNAKTIVSAIRRASCVVATRFHSMIIGMSVKVPVIPVVYNEKTLNVLQDLGYEQCGVLLDQLSAFDFDGANYAVIDELDAVKEMSYAQFAALDKLLAKEN